MFKLKQSHYQWGIFWGLFFLCPVFFYVFMMAGFQTAAILAAGLIFQGLSYLFQGETYAFVFMLIVSGLHLAFYLSIFYFMSRSFSRSIAGLRDESSKPVVLAVFFAGLLLIGFLPIYGVSLHTSEESRTLVGQYIGLIESIKMIFEGPGGGR
jgi:hypothetical protein